MKSPTNSTLQRRILLALANKNASSIVALARDLDAKRPSVSRSVKSLLNTKLIVRQRRTLSLTEAGQEEVGRIMTDIPIKARKATDVATYILRQATEPLEHTKPFDDMPDILRGIPDRQMMETINATVRMMESIPSRQMMETINATARMMEGGVGRQLLETMNSTTKLMEGVAGRQLIEMMNSTKKLTEGIASRQLIEAINATVRVQTINLDWLKPQYSGISVALNHLFIKNNSIISNMMVDLGTIAEIGIVNDRAFSSLINRTAKTATTYDAYFNSATQAFNTLPTIESLSSTIIVPTTTTASVIGSVRRIIESQAVLQIEEKSTSSEPSSIRTYAEQYIPMTSILEEYLKPLGEQFLNKWEGAWHTLYSGNKDRHSQATHSARELLVQVLAHLAPDEAFTKEDCIKCNVAKPSRKMQIRYILRSSDKHLVNLIDSLADTVDEMYHVLTGETHRRDGEHKEDETVAAIIAGLGNFLIMLLSMRNSKSS